MSGKYFGGTFKSQKSGEMFADELTKIGGIEAKLEQYIYNMQTHRYLEDLWRILTIGNVAIQKNEPWAKIKTDPDEVEALLVFIGNLLTKVAISISPVMPETAQKMAESLGIEINRETYQKFIVNGELLTEFTIKKIPALFPKVEEPLMKSAETPKVEEKKASEPKKKTTVSEDGLITIDKFFETTIKIGTVIEVEEVKKSKKLYRLMVDVGEAEPRQVVAGIREFYKAEELQDSQVCVVANLKPAKLMGLLSEGMLLAAKDENGLSLIRPEHRREVGTSIS
jgi:methionyl-tRNA synthetase